MLGELAEVYQRSLESHCLEIWEADYARERSNVSCSGASDGEALKGIRYCIETAAQHAIVPLRVDYQIQIRNALYCGGEVQIIRRSCEQIDATQLGSQEGATQLEWILRYRSSLIPPLNADGDPIVD